jgi:hypothetical protein
VESVPFAELNGGHERHLDVAVAQRMVLDQVRAEHGGLGREVRIEVLADEACPWGAWRAESARLRLESRAISRAGVCRTASAIRRKSASSR